MHIFMKVISRQIYSYVVETKDRRLYRWVIGSRGLKARRRTGGAVLGARG
jgi:hypothetical protein